MKSINLFLLLIVLGLTCKGQNPAYTSFTAKDGLPSKQVYEIFQDSKGYMWFGTGRGLVRYDGIDFEIFDAGRGVCSLFINKIKEDESGALQFMSLNCASWMEDGIMYSMNDSIVENFHGPKKKSRRKALHALGVTGDSLEWILNEEGYFRYADNQFQPIPPPNEKPYLVYSGKEVFFNVKGEKVAVPLDRSQLVGRHYFEYLEVGQNRYVIFYKNQLFLYENNRIRLIRIFETQINSLSKSRVGNGGVFVSTHKTGVYFFEGTELRESKQVLFYGETIRNAYEDHEGGLWVACRDLGLMYIPDVRVKTYTVKKEGIPLGNYHLVGKADSIYFVNETYAVFRLLGDSISLVAQYDNTVKKLAFDRNNDLVAAVYKNGIFRIRDNHKFYGPFLSGRINLYFTHQNELMFVKTSTGLVYKDYKSKNHDITNYMIFIAEKDSNSVYIGTNKGGYRFQLSDSSFSPVFTDCNLTKTTIIDMDVIQDTIILSAVNNVIVITEDSCFQIAQEQDSFIKNIEHNFIDEDGSLWLSSPQGLNRIDHPFDEEKRSVTPYTVLQGINSNRVLKSYVYNDTVWAATTSGISKFNKNIPQKKAKPILIVESVFVNNQHVDLINDYDLSYDQNVVRINFRGLTYKRRNSVRYQYRLLGADTNWITSSEHFALFAALSGGSYTFEIKAIGLLPGEESAVQCIRFTIGLPFWERWWFITLLSFAALGAVWVLFQQRLKRVQQRLDSIQQRQKMMDELNQITQKSLSSQLNPHFIFNALNSISRFVLENDKRSSNKYLSRFAQLMRLVLEYSKEPFISLEQELKAITAYLDLETLRLKEKINYTIDIDAVLIPEKLRIPPLLLQPIIENAIWHGLASKEGKGNIKIEVKDSNDDNYCCVIEDDGVGRKKGDLEKRLGVEEHQSTGMSMTERRIALASKLSNTKANFHIVDLINEVGVGVGTRIEIVLPKES